MPQIKTIAVNPYSENTYVVSSDNAECIIVDPGMSTEGECQSLWDYITTHTLIPIAIFLTHAHFDHIYGVSTCVQRYNIPVYMGEHEHYVKDHVGAFARRAGMPTPDTEWETLDLRDGQILELGGIRWQVIETPGHTEGGVSYYDETNGLLFSGDTLFAGAIGRSDLPTGDYDREIVSIMDKLMGLPGSVEVYPGHGPSTTIANERTQNPFLQPFNERDEETGAVDGIEFRDE